MNVKLSCFGLVALGFSIMAGCQNTSQSKTTDNSEPVYQSGESPSGIHTDKKVSHTGDMPKITRGACRVRASVTDASGEGVMVLVTEVRGYGPNYAYGFPLEGDTLKVVGAGGEKWASGMDVTVEVQPVFEGYRDEKAKVVKYVKTVE
jgi:hypothetical protein